MKQKITSSIKFLVFLSIGGGIMYWLLKDITFDEFVDDFSSANWFWVGLSLLSAVVSHFFRGARWKMIIDSMGYKINANTSFLAVMNGYFFNMFVPRLGEVSRCSVIYRYERVPVSKLFGTVIAERGFDIIMLGACVLLTMAIQTDLIIDLFTGNLKTADASNDPWPIWVWYAIAGIGIIGIAAAVKMKLWHKVKALANDFIHGIRTVRNVENKMLFAIHTLIIWVLYYFMAYFCMKGVGVTSDLGISPAIVVLTLGSIGMAAPSPGGMGTYHLFVIQALAVYGVGGDDALSFANVIYFSQIGMVIVVGGFSFIALNFVKRKELDPEKNVIKAEHTREAVEA